MLCNCGEEVGERRWNRDNLRDLFSYDIIDRVLSQYSDKQIDFILNRLNLNEIRAVKEVEDYLPAAIVSGFGNEKLRWLERRFKKNDFKHYLSVQSKWIKDERWYLGEKLKHGVTDLELLDDFQNNGFGLRFSALYILRHIKDKSKIVRADA